MSTTYRMFTSHLDGPPAGEALFDIISDADAAEADYVFRAQLTSLVPSAIRRLAIWPRDNAAYVTQADSVDAPGTDVVTTMRNIFVPKVADSAVNEYGDPLSRRAARNGTTHLDSMLPVIGAFSNSFPAFSVPQSGSLTEPFRCSDLTKLLLDATAHTFVGVTRFTGSAQADIISYQGLGTDNFPIVLRKLQNGNLVWQFNGNTHQLDSGVAPLNKNLLWMTTFSTGIGRKLFVHDLETAKASDLTATGKTAPSIFVWQLFGAGTGSSPFIGLQGEFYWFAADLSDTPYADLRAAIKTWAAAQYPLTSV